MKLGCFLTLLLLPILAVIWIEKERRRRAAMPPDELKAMDDEVNFGPFDPDMTCRYCETKGKIRRKQEECYINGGPAKNSPEGIKYALSASAAGRGAAAILKCEPRCFARCMKCGAHWEMFPSE